MDIEKKKFPVIPSCDPEQPMPILSWKNVDEITTSGEYHYKTLLNDIPKDCVSAKFSIAGAFENVFVGLASSSDRYADIWEIAISETFKKYKQLAFAIRRRNQGNNIAARWYEKNPLCSDGEENILLVAFKEGSIILSSAPKDDSPAELPARSRYPDFLWSNPVTTHIKFNILVFTPLISTAD